MVGGLVVQRSPRGQLEQTQFLLQAGQHHAIHAFSLHVFSFLDLFFFKLYYLFISKVLPFTYTIYIYIHIIWYIYIYLWYICYIWLYIYVCFCCLALQKITQIATGASTSCTKGFPGSTTKYIGHWKNRDGYWDGPMEVIVTIVSKLVYFTYLRDVNNLLI